MTNKTNVESTSRQTADNLFQRYESRPQTKKIAELYCLSQFWKTCVFSGTYAAEAELSDLMTFTTFGNSLIERCCHVENLLENDAKLALFGLFYWHDILVDTESSDVAAIKKALSVDLMADRIRLPYSWGRLLHDRFHDDCDLCNSDQILHHKGWKLLDDTPIGVFQHGLFVSGPLGVLRSSYHRWIPVLQSISCYRIEGTQKVHRRVPFETAAIGVVHAFGWMSHRLNSTLGSESDWGDFLRWHGGTSRQFSSTDYTDVILVVADCILGDDRLALLISILKSRCNSELRNALKETSRSGLANLPPAELASKLTETEQLQLLHCVSDETLVTHIDKLILSNAIHIPSSEVRYSHVRMPSRFYSFGSEVSSLGIRPAHSKPFAALCSAILQAYNATDSTELQWRLGSDSSRGVQVTLTEYVRKSGPQQSVRELILTSQPVTEKICQMLCIPISEIASRDESTISRILWKFGFEIPRHDDSLERFKKRLSSFESLLLEVDWSRGEVAREKIRSEGVNLFVSVEEFLDRLISYSVWLLASDHWKYTRFSYRLSSARLRVAEVLGSSIEGPDGRVSWKLNGENPLGTQLTYLSYLEQWLEGLNDRDSYLVPNIDEELKDEFGRSFPFRHSVLWADSDTAELERYREQLRRVIKPIFSGDIAGVRNGLDHQRDSARFPTEEQLEICTNKLKQAVKLAEQGRLYPVTFWFEEEKEKVFGSTEFVFKAHNGTLFSLYRPSMVSSLPNVTRIRPIIIAPVNFLGSADGILHFVQMGESNYSEYWSDYPRIAKSKEQPMHSLDGYEETTRERGTADVEPAYSGMLEGLSSEEQAPEADGIAN
jgi:hypothetical protein